MTIVHFEGPTDCGKSYLISALRTMLANNGWTSEISRHPDNIKVEASLDFLFIEYDHTKQAISFTCGNNMKELAYALENKKPQQQQQQQQQQQHNMTPDLTYGLSNDERVFIEEFNYCSAKIHDTAVAKGWWEKDRNDSEALMLTVCEIAEGVEGLRAGNPPDDKIPEFTAIEAELADAHIRLMDLAHKRKWRVAEAIVAKMRYNWTRQHKHGGKLF